MSIASSTGAWADFSSSVGLTIGANSVPSAKIELAAR
jgi:hypothetical protein